MLNFFFQAPNERARLYFLLAWFHAIVQERLTYAPLGWSKKYEFNESDLRCACDTIDVWIDAVAMGRTNLPPEKVPWDALRTLMSQCIYGGKIDNDFDQVYIFGLTIYYGVFKQYIGSTKKISKIFERGYGLILTASYTKNTYHIIFSFSASADGVLEQTVHNEEL